MRSLYLALFAAGFVFVLSLLQLLLLRVLNTVWWKRKIVRRLSLLLALFALCSGLSWIAGTYFHNIDVAGFAAITTSLAAVLSIALVGAFPLSGILNTIQLWHARRHMRREATYGGAPESRERRLAIQKLAVVFPAAALTMGSAGMARSFTGCDVREIPFYFPDLPGDLDGFRILHVSDTHLGPYIDLDDLEDMLRKASSFEPDLMLISGDIADHLDLLPDAIRLFDGLKVPYGAYASMGNHDYYRGASTVIRQFDASSIPMLINRGGKIAVGGTEVYIGGADDPRVMGVDTSQFLTDSVRKALDGAPSRSFKIIMSHRPSGFDAAAAEGVNFTVAGHTHGTQLGFMGRPLFEYWGREKYVWGKYQIGLSQLYTSSGVGHWFPFRLGCPTEAPVLVLRKPTSQGQSAAGVALTSQVHTCCCRTS